MTAVPAEVNAISPPVTTTRVNVLEIAKHGLIALQLVLVLAVFHAFALEQSSGFLSLSPLIVLGFAAHAALPMRLRAPFFLALTISAFWIALGPAALVVVAAGMALIGICHLPVAFRIRVAIVAFVGVLLALAVVKGIPGVSPGVARRSIAVFASMFMFRIVIYMYDLRHERVPVPVATRLSYFFLLPNAAFPFFPVVDWGAFKRNYYDRPSIEIYQRGVRLILRGAIHLLLYRYVYYFLTKSPDAVYGVKTVAIFLASSWLVYLHVSGLFHLIVGILCLFGHNLPETNKLYLFASSPNDLWRRVNVYWKDFMQKIFYMPAYKALQKRKISMKTSMLAATVVVFFATWLLHSYQWFWLVGRFPMTWIDAAFWGVFGALVVLNTVVELNKPRRRMQASASWSPGGAAVHVLKVMGMFTLMSLMFSWWSTRDAATWLYVVPSVTASEPRVLAMFAAGLVAVFVVGLAIHYAAFRGWTFGIGQSVLPFPTSVALTLGGALLLLAASRPEVQQRLGDRGRMLLALERERLNARDAAIEDRAYYEALITTDQPANPIFKADNAVEADMVPIRNSKAIRYTGDALIYELLPSKNTRNRGSDLIANALGLRDKEYSPTKPAATYRIALIGASVIMGSGADQRTTFEALTENRLNAEKPDERFNNYEILNFGVPGYGFHQFVIVAEQKALRYQPDVLLVGALAGDHAVSLTGIAELEANGVRLDPELTAILRRGGIGERAGIVEVKRKLRSNTLAEIRRWAYRRIADACRKNGVIPAFVYIPRLESDEYPPGFDEMAADAAAAGMVVMDLRGVYNGVPRSELMFHRRDVHPNARGHRMIAERLYQALHQRSAELGLTEWARAADTLSARNR